MTAKLTYYDSNWRVLGVEHVRPTVTITYRGAK